MDKPWSDRARLTELLSQCYNDPDLFNSAILGRPDYWWGQRQIAQSVCDYRITVALTGNAVGKDFLVGGLAPWWLYTRHRSLIIVNGPSQTVLGSVTWKEIRRASEDSLIPLNMRLSQGVKSSPLRAQVEGDWQALGYSTTSIERASGQHNRKLLVISEEASGIPDEIFEAIDSLKYVRWLLIGNPIRATGRFVDLYRQAEKDKRDGVPRNEAVNAIHLSSRQSPDAHVPESKVGLADATFIRDMERRYGKESLWVRCHIDALIPEESTGRLFPDSWLDRAVSCERPPLTPFGRVNLTRRISVDLGEGVGRDATAILVRDDFGVLCWVAGRALGLKEAAAEVARLARHWSVPHNRISYDRAGLGRDFRHYLVREGIHEAVGYVGAGQARDKRGFTNLRTEAAWTFHRRLDPEWSEDARYPLSSQQPAFKIPADENWALLREELEKITYELVGKQIKLISKEDLCIELGRSPDRSDALMQSFAF